MTAVMREGDYLVARNVRLDELTRIGPYDAGSVGRIGPLLTPEEQKRVAECYEREQNGK